MRSQRLLSAFLLAFLALPALAQSDSIFSISIAPPTTPKDVQVRYILDGNAGLQKSSSVGKLDDTHIAVKAGANESAITSFKAIAYAPNCQFVTFSVDDLAASDRQGQFQCQQLPTVPLQGRADVSRFAGKDLQVEVLYVCNWAGQFFGIPAIAVSPFSLGKTHVATDGAFTAEIPDFASDPLWSSFSHNARLVFYMVDAQTGQRLGQLRVIGGASHAGSLKVGTSYPGEIVFSAR